MRRSSIKKRSTRQTSSKRRRRWKFPRLWPSTRKWRGWFRLWRTLPGGTRVIAVVVVLIATWFPVNWLYQVLRKPAELFFPVSGTLYKTPSETWRQYESIFRKHSTAVITPDLLAALAQVEGSGNPVVRTYWRWYLTWEPFEVYRPASSAVGMYQITDGTFAEARRYCIHDHTVVEDGPWNELRSCWFNSLYTRVVPTHAVELTSAYLDRRVTTILQRQHIANATLQQKQDLAAVIHLCGAAVGESYVRRGFRLTAKQRCGDHDAAFYLTKVNIFKRVFARFSETNS